MIGLDVHYIHINIHVVMSTLKKESNELGI